MSSINTGNWKKPAGALVVLLTLWVAKMVLPAIAGKGLYLWFLNALLLLVLLYGVLMLVALPVKGMGQKVMALLKRVSFQLGLLAGTLFFTELIFQVLLLQNRPAHTFDGEFTQPSEIVGWAPWAGHSGKSVMVAGTDTIYHVEYSFDTAGRRVDSHTTTTAQKMHSIFIGCSVTLGEGLPADATFAAQLSQLDSNIHSYNYGMRGWGPHQTALLFNRLNTINRHTVTEDSGVCIYTYIDPHLWRVYGGLRYLQWGSSSPEVWVDDSGTLQSRPRASLQYHLLKWLSASATLRYFNIDYPTKFTGTFYKRFAAIVNYNAKEYYRLFPHGRFYVAMYPGIAQQTGWLKYLDSTVTVLQFPELEQALQKENSAYRMKVDGHPTRQAYELFAKSIYQKLQQP